jgi:beta-glucanase (GH16 family)
MTGFSFQAYIVRFIDADTVMVDPQIYKQDEVLRVRLKDVWAPEVGEEGQDLALEKAEAMFPVGSKAVLTNTRIKWTYGRLEARIDPA